MPLPKSRELDATAELIDDVLEGALELLRRHLDHEELSPGRSVVANVDFQFRLQYRAIWCERGELNPHELPHGILSPARLPIPPLSRWQPDSSSEVIVVQEHCPFRPGRRPWGSIWGGSGPLPRRAP